MTNAPGVMPILSLGVQVLPGEPLSKWRQVISEWIGHIPEYAGLKDDFKTDYAECFIHAPREMWNDKLDAKYKETVSGSYWTLKIPHLMLPTGSFSIT
jgi:hypothetical protein